MKTAGQFEFSTNEYSGPMNPVMLRQASDIPAFRQPQLQRGIQKNSGDGEKKADVSPSMPWDGTMNSGARQESDIPAFRVPDLRRGLLKNSGETSMPTDNPEPLRSDKTAMNKTAVLAHIGRLLATPIPHTPKMFMDVRSPEQLAQLHQGIEGAFRSYEKPLEERVGKLISHLPVDRVSGALSPRMPPGRLQRAVQPDAIRSGLQTLANQYIRNPDMLMLPAVLGPKAAIPGSGWILNGLKRGVEGAIDKIAPVPGFGKAASAKDYLPMVLPPVLAGAVGLGYLAHKLGPHTRKQVWQSAKTQAAAKLLPKKKSEAKKEEPKKEPKLASFTTSQLSDLVAELRKQGSPSSDLRQANYKARMVGAPKASAPKGPSIADIAKPKGAGFGSGMAGAYKTRIGGTAGVSLT